MSEELAALYVFIALLHLALIHLPGEGSCAPTLETLRQHLELVEQPQSIFPRNAP